MIISTLTVLAVIALTAWLSQRRRAAGVMLAVIAALWLGVGCGPGAQWLVDSLQPPASVQPSWRGRNAIVLLGAGTSRLPDGSTVPSLFANGRIIKAAQLYGECVASGAWCVVEVSGGDATHTGHTEAAIYGTALRSLGVPAEAIVSEDKSMNTWQNAQFSVSALSGLHPDAIWLVSSATHLRRASLYFAHAGIVTHPVAADYTKASMSWVPQAWNFAIADLALHEYVGVWQYDVYEAMGWNAPRAKSRLPVAMAAAGQ